MKATKLNRNSGWNPFYIENKGYLDKIIFFKKGEKVVEIPRGWFESGNNDFKEIILPFDVINKRKENLTKLQAYTIKEKEGNEIKTVLYIHLDLMQSVKIERKKVCFKDKTVVRYEDLLYFTIEGVKNIPEIIDREKKIVKWIDKPGNYEIKQGFNYCTEKTAYGLKLQKISDIAKSKKVNLSIYDLERLESVLNIEIK